MGGIVPYGYRKVGDRRDAHLVISEEPIPGVEMSEADVIKLIYRMAATEKKSCRVIAARLNHLRVPCAYTRDDRLIARGKRKERTSGVWRAGRVRNVLASNTYMGVHEWGKRAVRQREVIQRQVPAIVTEATWKKAQQTLSGSFLFGARNAKTKYLLRGLIKCGLCGKSYVGMASVRPNGKKEFYYRCNGAHSPQVYWGLPNGRCKSKAVRGDHLEEQVWSDMVSFLRNPRPVPEQLHALLESDAKGSDQIRRQVARLEGLLAQKATERSSRVVALYRRGRLTDADLDAQMEEIGREEAALEAQAAELRARIAGADSIGATISSAEALLAKLRKRLDEPVSWEVKRRLVEVLVAGIRVETFEEDGVKQARTTMTYRFHQPDAMPLVLPRSYQGRVVRIPKAPQTIGDHLRRRRLALKLLQRDVAERLGVTESSIWNWEAGHPQPDLRSMPTIIAFLGYNLLPEAKTLAEKLVRHRTTLGMSQKEAAKELGVDPGTLARWERGEREPEGAFMSRLQRFLVGDKGQRAQVRRVG